MRRLRFLLILLIITKSVQSQPSTDYKIAFHVLCTAIQSEVVKREFRICEFICDRIDLFDFNNIIDDHPIHLNICGKQVYQFNTQSLDHPSPNSIVIYRLDRNESGLIKIYLLRPFTGAAVILTYKIEEEIELIETEIGSF
jgi:hypothetical protein